MSQLSELEENEKKKPITKDQKITFIVTNNHFKLAYLSDPTVNLFWSENLEMHFLVIKIPEVGYLFENGTFVSYNRAKRDMDGMPAKMQKVYLSGLSVFKDKGFEVLSEEKYLKMKKSEAYGNNRQINKANNKGTVSGATKENRIFDTPGTNQVTFNFA